MAQTVYRQSQPTLADILAGSAAQPGSPPQDTTAPPNSTGNDQPMGQLLRMLMEPESQGPAPEVKEAPWWSKMLMGMGDAYKTYGSILGGGSAPADSSFDKYLRSQERAKADLGEWQKKTAEAQREAKLRGAQFLLGREERSAKLSEDKQAKTEERAYREKVASDAAKEHQLNREAQARGDEANNAARIQIEKMGNDARARSDGLQAELHRMRQAGEADKDQHTEYAKSRQYVVSKKAEYSKALAEGTATPEQIIEDWQNVLDASDLSGKYREAADAFSGTRWA